MYPTTSLPELLSRLGRLPGGLEELIENLASKPREWWMRSFPYPLVNVREEAEAFHVEAEVPGLTQDQIEVLVRHGREVTIQGERRASPESGTWHHRERGAGRFQRVLRLPVAVDADKVQARLALGVLHLTLPKSEAVKPHRISVQGDDGEVLAPAI
jgi:HSP20 family protein